MGKKNKRKQKSSQSPENLPNVNFSKSKVGKPQLNQASFSGKKKKAIKQEVDSTSSSFKTTKQRRNKNNVPFSPNKIEVSVDKPLSKNARRKLKKLQSQEKRDSLKIENYIPLTSPKNPNTKQGQSNKKQNSNDFGFQPQPTSDGGDDDEEDDEIDSDDDNKDDDSVDTDQSDSKFGLKQHVTTPKKFTNLVRHNKADYSIKGNVRSSKEREITETINTNNNGLSRSNKQTQTINKWIEEEKSNKSSRILTTHKQTQTEDSQNADKSRKRQHSGFSVLWEEKKIKIENGKESDDDSIVQEKKQGSGRKGGIKEEDVDNEGEEEEEETEEEAEEEEETEEEVDVKDFIDDEAEEGEEVFSEDEAEEDEESSEDETNGGKNSSDEEEIESDNMSPQTKKRKFSPPERNRSQEYNEKPHKVFINNLPQDATEEQLRQSLGEVGTITSVTIPKSKENEGECRGFAFVELQDQETLQKVIGLDGSAHIGDHHLNIRLYATEGGGEGRRGGGGRGFRGRGGRGRGFGGRGRGFGERGGRGRGFGEIGGRGRGFGERGGRGRGGFGERGGRGFGERGGRGRGFGARGGPRGDREEGGRDYRGNFGENRGTRGRGGRGGRWRGSNRGR